MMRLISPPLAELDSYEIKLRDLGLKGMRRGGFRKGVGGFELRKK